MGVTIRGSRDLFEMLAGQAQRAAAPIAVLETLAEELLAIEENTFAARRSPNGRAWPPHAAGESSTASRAAIRSIIASGELFFRGAHHSGVRHGRSTGPRRAAGAPTTLVRTGRLAASRSVRVEDGAIVAGYSAPYAAYVTAGRGPGPRGASRARPILPRSSRSGRGTGPAGVWFRSLADRIGRYIVSGEVAGGAA